MAVTFTKLMISFLLIGFLVAIGLSVIADSRTRYSIAGNSSEFIDSATEKIMNDSIITMEQQKDAILNQTIDSGSESWYSMMVGAYVVIKTPFTLATGIFGMIGDLFNDIGGKLGIPPIVGSFVITCMAFVVIGMLLKYIFRIGD